MTGRYIVVLRDNGIADGLRALKDAAGLSQVCSTADYEGSQVEMAQAESSEVFLLDKLKVAVVNVDPGQATGLQAAATGDSAILAVEPERIMYALPRLENAHQPTGFHLEYLRGYRDAVDHLYATLAGESAQRVEATHPAAAFADTPEFTWGLQATRVCHSPFSGRGIRVAVLDTGFCTTHPDFQGRTVVSQSFVPGEEVNDFNGHGTHCIGTALGSRQSSVGSMRYGCAFQAEIYAGKVLSNQGSGADSGILAGINWAITHGCRIVSMSLGAPVRPGESYSTVYEHVARRALRSAPGTLIVAAAGNDSDRPDSIIPVSRPANCPSILAVGAINMSIDMAFFSNGGINPRGGGVDIAAPGVDIFSSVPDPFPASVQPSDHGRPWPARYYTLSGTSMATPHVAGIAALWLEARGQETSAQALWQYLTGNALRLTLSSRDVGAGLAQAPA
jgi:hypothetical protein